MPGVKMVSRRNLNQFLSPGKFVGQPVKQVEPADDEAGEESRDRGAQQKQQNPEQPSRLRAFRQYIEAQTDEGDRNGDERYQTDKPVENHREQSARLFVPCFLEQKIALNNIAAGSAGQKLIIKHADKKQSGDPWETESDFLHAQQNLPTKRRKHFHQDVGQYSGAHPSIVGGAQCLRHFGALVGIVKYPNEHAHGDGDLKKSEKDLFHSPKCSFQIVRDCMISSADKRGLSSHTIWQFCGNMRVSSSSRMSPR